TRWCHGPRPISWAATGAPRVPMWSSAPTRSHRSSTNSSSITHCRCSSMVNRPCNGSPPASTENPLHLIAASFERLAGYPRGRWWALPGLVRNTRKQRDRRARGHPPRQLGYQMRCEDGAVENVSDDDDRDDGQHRRPKTARRPLLGPHLDDVPAFGICAAEKIGEDHHLHAHRQGVVDGVLVAGPLPQPQAGNHVPVMEDAEPGSHDRVEEEGPAEADGKPD